MKDVFVLLAQNAVQVSCVNYRSNCWCYF